MSVLIARTLGASGKGTLTVVQLVASFVAIALNFGIAQAFTYYAARKEIRGRDAVALTYSVAVGVVALLMIAVLPFRSSLAELLHVRNPAYIMVGLLATAPVLVAQYLNAYVFGTGAIRNSQSVNVGSLFFQLASVAVLTGLGKLTPATAIAVWAVATVGSAAVFTRLAWGGEADEGIELGSIALLRRVLRYGMAAWPAGLLGTAAQRFDVFLLASMRGTAEVGIYSIAVTMAELCWYFPNALGGVLLPKVASEGDSGLQITLRMGRLTWLITAIAALGVLAVGAPLVPLVFGREFARSIMPLALILPGIVVGSMSTAAGAYLSGSGRPVVTTIAAGVNVATNVVVNLLLIPKYGAAGAAVASSVSYSAAAVVVIWNFTKHSGATAGQLLVPRLSDITAVAAAAKRAIRRAD